MTNVLLLVWDTCRRDALEPYGAPAGASSAVAQLAARGVAADHAHSASSWTMPSHTAFFTGTLPRELGLTQAPGGTVASCRDSIVAQEQRLLPAVLRRGGYETKGSSANIWISPEGGFDTGFDFFELVTPDRHTGMHHEGVRARAAWAWQAIRARSDDGAGRQRSRVLGWVDELADKPFFWFVNLNECHSPYLPPKPFNSLGAMARATAADEAKRYLNLMAMWRVCAGGAPPPAEALERMRVLYADSVRQMDAWLADVLEALDRAGRLDDTLVVLTSDHGENFGEGNYMAHAFSLDQRLCHVPFVAAGPGADQLADIRSLTDLPRRLCDIAGVPHEYPEHAASVSQFDPPGDPDDPRIADLAQTWPEIPREQLLHRIARPLTAVVDGTFKLVLRGEAEEFYDLAADPLELAPTTIPADVAGRLRAALATAAEGAGTVKAGQASADELGDLEERMRLLGYL